MGEERPTCSLLVKNATEEIFKLVVNGQICVRLGVCQQKKSVPWEKLVEVVDAAKIQSKANKISQAKENKEDEEGNTNNIVIQNINNNIMNVHNTVAGNTIIVNDHVKVDNPAPPHPPKDEDDAAAAAAADSTTAAAAAATLSIKNPMECRVCEYVGLALLLGQTPEAACKAAFSSQPATKVDACLGFAAPFGKAMKESGVEGHSNVLQLCRVHKYC